MRGGWGTRRRQKHGEAPQKRPKKGTGGIKATLEAPGMSTLSGSYTCMHIYKHPAHPLRPPGSRHVVLTTALSWGGGAGVPRPASRRRVGLGLRQAKGKAGRRAQTWSCRREGGGGTVRGGGTTPVKAAVARQWLLLAVQDERGHAGALGFSKERRPRHAMLRSHMLSFPEGWR